MSIIATATVEERREMARAIHARVTTGGEKVKDVAQEMGESAGTVYSLLRHFHPLPPKDRRTSRERDNKIARTYLYRKNVTMAQLARHYGITKQHVAKVVQRYLHEHGQGSELGRTRKQRTLARAGNEQSV